MNREFTVHADHMLINKVANYKQGSKLHVPCVHTCVDCNHNWPTHPKYIRAYMVRTYKPKYVHGAVS